jgi:alanine-glyoxylate transaminase/serine-glyoxylate transaminase/serine-pyruvate transaminase
MMLGGTAKMDKISLMIPGPIELPDDVRMELSQQVNAHYGKEWADFYNSTISLLKQVFQTTSYVFPMVGSGTAGIESVISSMIAPGDRLMVLTNGFFGDRLSEIARSYRAEVIEVSFPLNVRIDPDRVRKELKNQSSLKAVAMVHSESSTGMLNPLREVAAVCQKFNIPLIVDAVSSLGGVEVRMDEWGIGACITASQKCLESPTGLALVAVSDWLWPIIERTESLGWYLNLKVWKNIYDREHDYHPHPTSMSTPLIRALKKSLENILAEGLSQRFKRHIEMSQMLRSGLAELGFEFFLPYEISSPTVISVLGNRKFPADTVVDKLEKKYKIKIAGGVGPTKGKIFRIGCMGSSARPEKIQRLISSLREIVEDHQCIGL